MADVRMPEERYRDFAPDWTDDHGDRLFSEGQAAEIGPARPLVVVSLLVLCLIPRVWAGTLQDVLCPDAVSYIRSAEALKAGDLSAGFARVGVNIYPPLLLGLEYLPGDLPVAARWWSVVMAVLTVLPLYGWIRRQFNETLALFGCGFYALHPAMIHDSPLIVRDPTFWFLFALGLYTAWRAVSGLRFGWFAGFALVFILAIHLRTEGWLLGPVFLVWLAFRLPRSRTGLAVILAAVLTVGAGLGCSQIVDYLTGHLGDVEIPGDVRHVHYLQRVKQTADTLPISEILDGALGVLVRYVKAFGYLHLLFAAVGAVYWGRRLFAPSKGALLLFFLLSFGAILAICCMGEMDRRYAFPSVMVSLPTMATGLCVAAEKCAALAGRSQRMNRLGLSFWLVCLAVVSALFLSASVVASPRPHRYDHVEIGRWIRKHTGPGTRIAVNLEWTRLVEYYSDGRVDFRFGAKGPGPAQRNWPVGKSFPPVVLIWLDWRNPAGREPFEAGIQRAKQLGYREVPPEELPEACRHILVLVRDGEN